MLQPPQGPLAKALRPEWTETGDESWGLAGPVDSGCTSPLPPQPGVCGLSWGLLESRSGPNGLRP